LAQVEALGPTLILTELDLPDLDGFEVIRLICSKKHKAPIIVVSARFTSQEFIIAALDAGADDFVPKPFSIGELRARVRVALRHAAMDVERHDSRPHEIFRAGDLEVDFYRRWVQVSGRHVHLTPVEYEILSLLISNANRVLTYDHLLGSAWKSKKDRGPHHVCVHMASLRRKLEPDPANPRHLVTEPGVGYQFHSTGW
jgi:two-component system KDP operon response regulator KdpE